MILSRKDLEELVRNSQLVKRRQEIAFDIASIGLHLDDQVMTYEEFPKEPFEPPMSLKTRTNSIGNDGFILPPMGTVLGCSEETVAMPLSFMGFVQTKGSLARGFLCVQLSDGQIDPGFQGKITFEIVNLGQFYFKLRTGMPIAQLFIHKLSAPVEPGYAGRYQGAGGPTPMRPPVKA
jgi:dCTP deaminase